MNPLASLIPQRKKNNLIQWLNKPVLNANLTPIQKFVERTTKGAHAYFSSQQAPDDQTVDTISTWEEKCTEHSRIKQTVCIVSCEPPISSIHTDPLVCENIIRRKHSIGRMQKKSQQKNKVLMLLQLEDVIAARQALRLQWTQVLIDFVQACRRRNSLACTARTTQRMHELDERIRTRQERRRSSTRILDLEAYYRKYDACLEELHERNEIMDLEAFKQLVIREVEERAEAQQVFRERLKVLHGQLMQKFIVDELIEDGLYSGPSQSFEKDKRDEWIELDNRTQDARNYLPENPLDGSEWVLCDML